MTLVFTDIDSLAQTITGRFSAPAIIGIDGWMSSGKSYLAESLALRASGSKYDLDHALIPDLGYYVDAIRLDRVSALIQNSQGLLFIAGVCIRDVFERVGCDAAAYIYVKRMSTWGWADEDEMIGGSAPQIAGVSEPSLRMEVRRYHQRRKPHHLADFEFQRLG